MRLARIPGLAVLAIAALSAALFVVLPLARAAAAGEWKSINYAALVDGRELSHSGEPVAVLLKKLEGRPLPSRPGERPADLTAHVLLDPLLERYAFVLPDALDALTPAAFDAPMFDIGSLWQPGEPQPAWVELLRARAMLLESDGEGKLRAFLPIDPAAPAADSESAAKLAWERAWPVLRHALAAERQRLANQGKNRPEDHPLDVAVYAFRHEPARTRFGLGAKPHLVNVTDTRPRGDRPPLDLEAWQRFIASGLRLEGARLAADGQVVLFGAETSRKPALYGRPVALADFVAAYRAVFHGGVGEPYMSLDRGFSPQTSVVNYGGRLRDTALGQVSLLCDVRFKTFSQGIDPVSGLDVREATRRKIPGFRAHVERFAADPRSASVPGQQTRLWFYPDSVEVMLSERGDMVALSRARMTAASERVEAATMKPIEGEDPPWTKDTIAEINKDYDALAGTFPELAGLDDAVRLLSLFTWLRQAQAEGLPVAELDALLGVETPALSTPRRYPQLLAVNVLPEAGSQNPVLVVDRAELAESLDRIAAPGGRILPAQRRFRRALAALDRTLPDHAALAQELDAIPVDKTEDTLLDVHAYRAERLAMHRLSLISLNSEQKAALQKLSQSGEKVRVFSLGIGGLDLGMSQTFARAERKSSRVVLGGLAALGVIGREELATDAGSSGGSAPPARTAATTQPGGADRDFKAEVSGGVSVSGAPDAAPAIREEWRTDSPALPAASLPGYGAEPSSIVQLTKAGAKDKRVLQLVYGPDSPDARSRKLVLDAQGRAGEIERFENDRLLRYKLIARGDDVAAELVPVPAPAAVAAPASTPAPTDGLLVVETIPQDTDTPAVRLRLRRAAAAPADSEIPRGELKSLILGREVAAAKTGVGGEAIATFQGAVGGDRRTMFIAGVDAAAPPWQAPARPIPGEEDPVTLADAIRRWHPAKIDVAPLRTAVVGLDAATSPGRWKRAPAAGSSALVLAPEEAFQGYAAEQRKQLAANWKAGPIVSRLPERVAPNLVILVSAEPPAMLSARLRTLARQPALKDKLLAAVSFGGPIRRDLAASLLADGQLSGVGVADVAPAGQSRVLAQLLDLGLALAENRADRRVEDLPGPFVWFF